MCPTVISPKGYQLGSPPTLKHSFPPLKAPEWPFICPSVSSEKSSLATVLGEAPVLCWVLQKTNDTCEGVSGRNFLRNGDLGQSRGGDKQILERSFDSNSQVYPQTVNSHLGIELLWGMGMGMKHGLTP